MANASLEDCQLFAHSEILQRDLFIAAKDQEDHPKKREDCVQHEAESVSASSLKINRFRNRWNSGEAHVSKVDPVLVGPDTSLFVARKLSIRDGVNGGSPR